MSQLVAVERRSSRNIRVCGRDHGIDNDLQSDRLSALCILCKYASYLTCSAGRRRVPALGCVYVGDASPAIIGLQ